MKRRDFLKTSCSLCMAAEAGLWLTSLSSCSTAGIYKTVIAENKISVPVSLFEQHELQIIRPKNFDYDIALRKENNDTYTALLMRCTHASNELVSNGNGFICNFHGSKFDSAGLVLKGPAANPLKSFSTEIISDMIVVTLL